MPRILIASLFHETHTFLDGTTGLNDFLVKSGAELMAQRGDSSPLGGVIELADELGWEIVPTVDYRAQPSAIVEDEVVESFWSSFAELATPALQEGIDGIYLVLHGAMVSQSNDDVEGEILTRLRKLPGAEKLPVFGVFDLHANFSPHMAKLAECLVAYRENPHIDAREAGLISARLLDRCLRSGERPRTFWRHARLMWPPTGTGTANDPMQSLEKMARAMETADPRVWSVSVVAGFSFADTPDTGVSFAISTTLPDAEAEELLNQLCNKAWELRALGNATEPPASEVLQKLFPSDKGPIVLVEPSDNIGGGAPGDGTGLLRALLAWRIPNCAVCIADPEAVAATKDAPKGQRVQLSIGGKGSRLDAGPVELEVEVISHSNGKFELEDKQSHLASMCGDQFDMGPSVVVRHKEITLLITSVKTPPFDLGQWRSQGLEPKSFSFIAVKAAVAHRRAYDSIAAEMHWLDTAGPCSSNVLNLPFKKVKRPIYPLDD